MPAMLCVSGACSVILLSLLSAAFACTDLIPGWQDKDGKTCADYHITKKWCSASGTYDHEWDPDFRAFFADYTSPGESLTAADVCCGCGAGVCKDEKQWLDSRGWSCDQYYQEGWCPSGPPAGESFQDYAVDNVSAVQACCHCGGGCQSSQSWADSAGNNCSAYYHKQWCAWTGGVGPGWNSSWGAIEDYAVNNESAWDACCECSRCKDDYVAYTQVQAASNAAEQVAHGCKVVRRLRLMLGVTDATVFRHVRSFHILEALGSGLTSMAGFENATAGDIRIRANQAMTTVAGIGAAYDNIMNLFIVGLPFVRDLRSLPTFSKIQRILHLSSMASLESFAAFGSLREVGWMFVFEMPVLKSFHGFERLHTITARSWLTSSIMLAQVGGLRSLDAFGGIRGVLPGMIEILLDERNEHISAQGLLGMTRTCGQICYFNTLRFLVRDTGNGGRHNDSYCFPTEDHTALQSRAGLAILGVPEIDPPSFGDGCTRCAHDCGYLSHGYRIACDYRVGLCGCPLGTVGPGCTETAPEVRMLPGQSKECRRPRKADGDVIVCEVCVAVQAGDYNSTFLDPPRTLRVQEAGSSSIWPWPQEISWQTPFEGTLCTNVTLSAVDPPGGPQNLELALAYSDATQDFFLPGSMRQPLLNPIEPMYPWCLDSGDCTQFGNDTVTFSLLISEPPTGQVEFPVQELWFREGSVGAVVVSRVGGDYGSLTAVIEVDNSSAAIQDFHYLWSGVTISWLHGDSRSKAFAVVLKDNSVAENDVALAFHLPSTASNKSNFKLWIQDDGDAGQLGLTTPRLVRPEAAFSSGCLFSARREGGSSGRARVRVQVAECLAQASPAMAGEDFLFAPGVLTWEDGDVGEKCAVFAEPGTFDGAEVQGAAKLAILEDASTERDEEVCIGLSKLSDSVAEVTATESSTFAPLASLSLLDRGANGGPAQAACDRGSSCQVDLSNSNFAQFLVESMAVNSEAYVSLALGVCPLCDAPEASGYARLNASYLAGWEKLDVDPGQYLVCLCACTGATCPGRAVASITVTGVQGRHQATCSLGQECQLPTFQGLGLQSGDAITSQELCGQTELLDGLPSKVAMDSWGNGSYGFTSSRKLSGSPGLFNLCWCRPSGGRSCSGMADFEVQAGLFKVEGPRVGQTYECVLNETCALSNLVGTGLKAGDRLMVKESCESATFAEFGAETSVAVTQDGKNFSFGLLSSAGEVLQELALCWCPASATCRTPSDYRAPVGTLSIRCPKGFYWPTSDGVPLAKGECQACSMYQKTVQSGSIGRAACVCRTQADGFPFQQVTDGNCGCRDGFHWSATSQRCVACNEGQDCLWENLFSLSLETPPLVPGHWSDAEGSVYRCFSRSTCPFTNSTCAAGRTGKACALCKQGYVGGHDGECEPFMTRCALESSQASLAQYLAIGIPVVIVLISLGMVCLARRHKQVTEEENKHIIQTLSGLREAVAQNFQYLQLLSIVSLFQVRWPPLLSEIWGAVRTVTSELITIPSLGCILPHPSSFNEMLARYLIPVVLAVLTLISWLLIRLVRKLLKTCPCGAAQTVREYINVRGIQILELMVLTGCLFYSLIVRNGFILFTCAMGPNGVSSVVIYPHIDCPSTGADLSDWLELFPFALAYNLIFSFGFTCLVWYAARKVAEEMVRSDFSNRGPWAFVATEYRDTYTWWLIIKMTKDLVINILAALFTNLGSIQLLSTAVVSTFYGYLSAHHHPFRDPMNNMLEVWGALSVGGICFFASGMGFAYDAEDDYAETALENEELGEDGSLRAQILLAFQLISFAGGFAIMMTQLVGVSPGCARWIPKRMRPRGDEELADATGQLQVAFKAADFTKYDNVAVARNLALLQESRALLKSTDYHIQRSGSLSRFMPGRYYMAQLIRKGTTQTLDGNDASLQKQDAAPSSQEFDVSPEMSPAEDDQTKEATAMQETEADADQIKLQGAADDDADYVAFVF